MRRWIKQPDRIVPPQMEQETSVPPLIPRGRFRARNPTETGLFCCLTKLCIIPPSMAVKNKTVQRSLDLTGNAEGAMTKYWAFARAAHGATRSRSEAPTSASNAAWTPVAETTQPSPCRLSQQPSWPLRTFAPTVGRGCWRNWRSKIQHNALTRENPRRHDMQMQSRQTAPALSGALLRTAERN